MKNENVRKRKLTREKQRLLLWEKNMGFLSRLFGGNQSNAVEQVRSQHGRRLFEFARYP